MSDTALRAPLPARADSGLRSAKFRRLWPLLPTSIFLLIVFLIPVSQLLWLSIVDAGGEINLDHYERLFSTTLYFNVLKNTFSIALWTTLICIVAGYPVAYLLASVSPASRSGLLIWVMVPFWTSFLVRSFAWMLLLGRDGVLNQWMASLGVIEQPLKLMYNFFGVMVGMSHAMLPIAILTMLSVMQSINPNLTRAASTLGAGTSHSFWRIYFPLSLPGVAAAGLLVFITAMGFFITPTLLGSPREMMMAQLIIIQIEEMLNWGFAGAISVMLLVAAFSIFYLFDRVLGMSALTGGASYGKSRGRDGLLSRLGSDIGRRFIAGISWIGWGIGHGFHMLFRPKYDRPGGQRMTARWLVGLAVIIFLAVPTFFVIPLSFSENSFFGWPPRGFSLQWYEAYFSSAIWQEATLRSVGVGLSTAMLSVVLGTPAAFFLSRQQIAGKTAIIAFILSPIILPHIVVAVALFYAYSYVGLIGTNIGLVIGHTVFTLPYVIITVMAVLKNYDQRLDQAAWTLGADQARTFRYITFPLIRTGLITAFLFAFVRSFDELTIALFVSGGIATTLPRQMWSEALLNISPTLAAVSTLMLVFVAAIILIAEFVGRRSRRR
ncbi:spermidine/putrescine ABC transporter ATP-binding protein [Agaricicola taiwanensis]|uniref:Spermidine/putrescine ABC transporter ATP-binding protein n=1 Tax=Agaricicola taiwanensis TaxID=591372 RepID=A0A8J2VJV9_9RHOB|nr:ABC transporter permease subunit [Agaricicola taiwanensis]GGE28036.1 spermidine/putrescine ABC transporter ATP-binding protein [Agaricicola taiwanensis]